MAYLHLTLNSNQNLTRLKENWETVIFQLYERVREKVGGR